MDSIRYFIESIPLTVGSPTRIFLCSCVVDSSGTSNVMPILSQDNIDTSINATLTHYVGLLITDSFVPYHVMNIDALPGSFLNALMM